MELENNSTPLYLQLEEFLMKQIKDGTMKPGEKLPSERELCTQFNLSRITVRQALRELEAENLIYRSHGKGTFVSSAKVEQQMLSITPFQYSLTSKGYQPSTKYINFRIVDNSYKLSQTLNIPISQNLVELSLLGLGDNTPMAFYTSYFGMELGMKMKETALTLIDKGEPITTFDLYKHLPQAAPRIVDQTYEASVADSYIAEELQIKKGWPILIVESVVYDQQDQPLECKTALYRGDKYKFSIIRGMD